MKRSMTFNPIYIKNTSSVPSQLRTYCLWTPRLLELNSHWSLAIWNNWNVYSSIIFLNVESCTQLYYETPGWNILELIPKGLKYLIICRDTPSTVPSTVFDLHLEFDSNWCIYLIRLSTDFYCYKFLTCLAYVILIYL